MQVQVNTDVNIEGHAALDAQVAAVVESVLERLRERITRVEVHLSDQNAGKPGPQDKRCVVEARLEGRQPIAATDVAPTVDQAVRGATGKLMRLIDSQLGKLGSL